MSRHRIWSEFDKDRDCNQQQADLAQSLRELLSDFQSGTKRHRTYRQFKMYNDPTMNPYLYSQKVTTR